jgi:hypothetical protein
MRKGLVLVLSALLVAFASASVAQAGGNPLNQGYSKPAAGGSYVGPAGCFAHGGSVNVPEGVPFTAFGGWAAATIGEVVEWLHASTNTLSVNGGPPIDMTPHFAGLTSDWVPGTAEWADIFFYQVTTLAPGESVHLAWFTATSHAMPDGFMNFPGKPGGASAFTFTCTVTGAA